ncbi:HNH endonuclease signature motif containing protein [Achromobacter mucicolens]|uniref:HNH endonuclease n=1 Tax=Achromobacter mucicolens TaxID=1389922 RepID=UPI00320868E6
MVSATFTTPTNHAYSAVGAHPPVQGWFAFDVLMPAAKRGEAKLFAMTVWNSSEQGISAPHPIRRDVTTGHYWYKVPRKGREKHPGKRTALWNGMGIAQKFNLPKIAILKCRKTKNCSLDHVFDIVDVRYEDAGSAFWLKLDTRGGDIGADVGEMDLSYLNKLPLQDPLSKDALSKVDSLKGSAEQLEATCEMAREVHHATISRSDAISYLHREHGINSGTASVWLNNYRCLTTGIEIRSPMSAEGMGIFADSLMACEGPSALENITSAISGFIRYAKTQWKYESHSMQQLLDRLQSDAIQSERIRALEGMLDPNDEDYEDDGSPSQIRKELWIRGPQHAALRRSLKRRWKNACAVHGVGCNGRLVASHIVPWSRDSLLRGDPNNGLLLSVPIDSLFDRGLISFDDEGRMVRSKRLAARTAEHFGVVEGLRLRWNEISSRARNKIAVNLGRHRQIHEKAHGYKV